MSMPTPEEWIKFGEVMITWGFWAIVYGAITMCIGLVIILIVHVLENKQAKFIK